MNIYVASSWKNEFQPEVVRRLRLDRHNVYDFKNPPKSTGFHWSSVMPNSEAGSDRCYVDEYLKALVDPIAEEGYASDMNALIDADVCILVLPCGKSAHLELGYAIGSGRFSAILVDGPIIQPELMYKMVDLITASLDELCEWARDISDFAKGK